MYKAFIASILLTLCLISSVAAQNETPITIEPARVLSHYGDSETVNLSLPIQAGVGVVATTDIKRSEASALRLHFVVSAPSAGPTWGVQVLDKNKKRVWSYSAVEDPSADFWSNEIPGELATVQVLAVAEISSLRLSIDRIIVSRKPTEGRGLTVNKLKSIDKAPPNIQGWGRSVARLVFVRDGSGQFLCTGLRRPRR
jgi:hypothetical protein